MKKRLKKKKFMKIHKHVMYTLCVMYMLRKELSSCIRSQNFDNDCCLFVPYVKSKHAIHNLYANRKRFVATVPQIAPINYVSILGVAYSQCVKGPKPLFGDYLKQYPMHNRIICMATGADISGDFVNIGGERIYIKCI